MPDTVLCFQDTNANKVRPCLEEAHSLLGETGVIMNTVERDGLNF